MLIYIDMSSEKQTPSEQFSDDDLRKFIYHELPKESPVYKAIMQDAIDNPKTGAVWLYCKEVESSVRNSLDIDLRKVLAESRSHDFDSEEDTTE